MKLVNVHQAKTHLSRLLRRVSRGDEVVIARGGTPVARLVPFDRAAQVPRLGLDEGRFEVPEDFNRTPAEVIAAFEGS